MKKRDYTILIVGGCGMIGHRLAMLAERYHGQVLIVNELPADGPLRPAPPRRPPPIPKIELAAREISAAQYFPEPKKAQPWQQKGMKKHFR